jgi:4-hydroxymandelate oxidase
MFVALPPAGPPRHRDRDLHLVRAVHRSFTGPAEFLADPANRAQVGEYLADLTRPYGQDVPADLLGKSPATTLGHSYGEMAEALIGSAVSPDEPLDLLILTFSVHDLWPGRQTAAYLSHVTPGAPIAFAVCDQGPAAAFSGLRIAREYAWSAGIRRALLIVVEQAALPYSSPAPLPSQHRGVAMLFGDGAMPQARVAALRQHPDVPPGGAAALAAADLAELSAGYHEVALVLGEVLAAAWTKPVAGRVRVMPPGQPCTAVWSGLIDEIASDAGHPDLLVAADYDPGLRYLCLTAFDTRTQPS